MCVCVCVCVTINNEELFLLLSRLKIHIILLLEGSDVVRSTGNLSIGQVHLIIIVISCLDYVHIYAMLLHLVA